MFGKRVSIEDKINKLRSLGLSCNGVPYIKRNGYSGIESEVTRYEVSDKAIGMISVSDSPQDAWRDAIKILGI